MRPGFKEDTVKCPEKHRGNCVAAVDMLGTAACICQGGLVWRRDSAATAAAVTVTTNNKLCMVRIEKTVIGGTDVR